MTNKNNEHVDLDILFTEFFSQRNFEKSRRFTEKNGYSTAPVRAALEFLGNPQYKYRTIHIAGTSLKGTSANYLQRFLTAGGCKTGLYVSPHLVKLNERISIDNKTISDQDFLNLFEKLKCSVDITQLSFFDALTIISFMYFHEQNVDYAVIETGLGGRLDSTNHLKPEFCLLTPIGYDHQNVLGKTLTEIAFEKCGIIHTHDTVFSFPQVDEASEMITRQCREKNATLSLIDESENRLSDDYALLVTRKIYETFFEKTAPLIKTDLPGRFEYLSKTPGIIFDSAHNEISITYLATRIAKEFNGASVNILLNTMKERNLSMFIDIFNQAGSTLQIYLFHTDNEGFYDNQNGISILTKETAINLIKKNRDQIFIITGSMRLYPEALQIAKYCNTL